MGTARAGAWRRTAAAANAWSALENVVAHPTLGVLVLGEKNIVDSPVNEWKFHSYGQIPNGQALLYSFEPSAFNGPTAPTSQAAARCPAARGLLELTEAIPHSLQELSAAEVEQLKWAGAKPFDLAPWMKYPDAHDWVITVYH